MSVDSHPGTLGLVEETGYSRKVHSTIRTHYGCLLHGILGCHFIEVGRSHVIHIGPRRKIKGVDSRSELEVRRHVAVDIILQEIVSGEVVVVKTIHGLRLRNRFRLWLWFRVWLRRYHHVVFVREIIGRTTCPADRSQTRQQENKDIFFHSHKNLKYVISYTSPSQRAHLLRNQLSDGRSDVSHS